jgi:hypothetical protein
MHVLGGISDAEAQNPDNLRSPTYLRSVESFDLTGSGPLEALPPLNYPHYRFGATIDRFRKFHVVGGAFQTEAGARGEVDRRRVVETIQL